MSTPVGQSQHLPDTQLLSRVVTLSVDDGRLGQERGYDRDGDGGGDAVQDPDNRVPLLYIIDIVLGETDALIHVCRLENRTAHWNASEYPRGDQHCQIESEKKYGPLAEPEDLIILLAFTFEDFPGLPLVFQSFAIHNCLESLEQ